MTIQKALFEDLGEILKLQYIAYQSEAELLNNFSIPPLKQTLEEVQLEYRQGIILKALEDSGRIIGSVRGMLKDDTLYIGKLIVRPDHQGKGIGTALLGQIEKETPATRFELFTSDRSLKNLKLYESLGYIQFKKQHITPDLDFIYLEKRAGKSRTEKRGVFTPGGPSAKERNCTFSF